MNLGELLPNETKSVYVEKGYNWNNVLICSNVAALLGGMLSYYTASTSDFDINFGVTLAATILSYLSIQSIMTDFRTLLINRNILRVAYISMYALTIYNLIAYDYYKVNTIMVVVFTVLLFLIFLFSSIGASDVRAMMVSIPYVVSIEGYIAIYMFLVVLLLIALYMFIKRKIHIDSRIKKEFNSIEHNSVKDKIYYNMAMKSTKKEMAKDYVVSGDSAVPVGPFMLAPFVVFLIIYPFIA